MSELVIKTALENGDLKMDFMVAKEYTSKITLVFGGNNENAKSEKEYKKIVKEKFYEEYNLELRDDEIIVDEEKLIMERV